MLERFVSAAVLYRLDSPAIDDVLESELGEDAVRDLADAIQGDTSRMDDLAGIWADGEISSEEWIRARGRIQARLEVNRRELAKGTGRDAAQDYIRRGDELKDQWSSLNISRQVAVVKAALASATIMSAAVPGRHGLDAERVLPEWRL